MIENIEEIVRQNPWTLVAPVLAVFYLVLRPKGLNVKDKLVLITGGSQGIGKAVAEQLVHKGAQVILLARGKDKLIETKAGIEKEVGAKAQVHVYPCDCSNSKDVDRVTKAIKQDLRVPDVLINNAGIGEWRFLHEVEGDDIKHCFEAPPFAAAFLARAFFLDFVARNSGVILNVMSPAALVPFPGATAYNMARWALRGFSQAIEGDLVGTSIKVQDVWLGEVKSEYFVNNPGSSERLPPGSMPMSVSKAAKAVVRGLESGNRSTFCPWWLFVFESFPYAVKLSLYHHAINLRKKAVANLNKKD